MSSDLTQQDLERYERLLRAILRRSSGTTEQIGQEFLNRGDGGLDTQGDAGSDREFEEVDLDAIDIEEGTVEATSEALRRLVDGTYGRCTRCEGTIPKGRLDVVPYAPFCVTCQEADEAGD